MSAELNAQPLRLPTRFTGRFGLVLFHQHHGVLLLRSGDREDGGPRRIELLFRGVVWMSIPSWFSDFSIEQCLIDEIIEYIPPGHRAKAQSRKVYRVDIDRTPHYIIAGSVFASSDDAPYFDPSPLLPEIEVNLKFDTP
jgi:hypothetical protein